jgi:2-hydroxychromene-2-carboxylate isomerase
LIVLSVPAVMEAPCLARIAAHYRQERRSGKTRGSAGSFVNRKDRPMASASGSRLEFWYDFASTYSYLSAMRIERLAASAGVELVWKPFLLGPIFRTQGWDTSPFNIYPAKGRYMVRDIERLAATRGLPFKLPTPFPQNSLYAARLALIGLAEGWGVAFTRAVYHAEFADGADIGDKRVLAGLLAQLGPHSAPSLIGDAEAILARSELSETKQRLRQQTEEAQELGIFGAPSFLARNELFWGDDRLEEALAVAAGRPIARPEPPAS